MADVYKGIYKQKEAAIKIYRVASDNPVANEQNKELFLKEAKMIAFLHDPNIVPFYWYGVEQVRDQFDSNTFEERPYIIMAYANAGSVRSFQQQQGEIKPEQTVDFLVQAASGLQYAHERGVLHRDIKPENLLLHKENPEQNHLRLLVADFGIAITAHPLYTPSPLTPQAPFGTAHYEAPEQFDGKAQIPSDIYSLGIVAYELLTGRRPFSSSHVNIIHKIAELYEAHKSQLPPSFVQARGEKGMNDILADMEEIVMGALEKDPAKRPQNIQVFAFTLKEAHDKAVEREKAHKTIIDMVAVKAQREKQREDAQQHTQLPPTGQIFLPAVNRPDKTDKTFWVGTTESEPTAQDQGKQTILPTIPVSQYYAQSAHHLPGHQQEAPQQPAANQPDQAEADKPSRASKGAQEPPQEEVSRRKEEARNWLKRANKCEKAEKYEEALQAIDQALKLDPTDALSHYNKGLALNHLRQYQEALQALDRAIELDPEEAFAYRQRGIVLISLDQYQEGLNALDQALKLDPADAFAYEQKGYVLNRLGRYQEALHALDQAIELNSTDYDAFAYRQRGVAYYNLGKQKEALQSLDQALKLDPTDALSYYNKGYVLSDLGRYQEALAAYEQALAIDPTFSAAAANKQQLLKELGKSTQR